MSHDIIIYPFTDKVKPLLSIKCHTTQIFTENSILQYEIGSFMIHYQTLTVDNCPNCISVSYKNIWIVHPIKNLNWFRLAVRFQPNNQNQKRFSRDRCLSLIDSRWRRLWFILLNSYLSRYRLSVILIYFKNCLFGKLGPQTSLDSTLLCVETRMKVSFWNHKGFLQATMMTLATFFHPSHAVWLMRHCSENVPVKFNYRTGTDCL